jgi:hypothetical protein
MPLRTLKTASSSVSPSRGRVVGSKFLLYPGSPSVPPASFAHAAPPRARRGNARRLPPRLASPTRPDPTQRSSAGGVLMVAGGWRAAREASVRIGSGRDRAIFPRPGRTHARKGLCLAKRLARGALQKQPRRGPCLAYCFFTLVMMVLPHAKSQRALPQGCEFTL